MITNGILIETGRLVCLVIIIYKSWLFVFERQGYSEAGVSNLRTSKKISTTLGS
jgi:hypothetical protein